LHPSFPGKKTAERRSYRRRSGRVSSFSLGASKMMCNFRGLGAGSSDLQIFPAFCLGFRMISIYFIEKNWLVVFRHPSEKYEFVSWDDDIPNRWKNRKCSKPPTRQYGIYSFRMKKMAQLVYEPQVIPQSLHHGVIMADQPKT
jgi:hypothetical protein